MEEEMLILLTRFGLLGIWGVVVYKVLCLMEFLVVLGFIGYGIKKAWSVIKKEFIDN